MLRIKDKKDKNIRKYEIYSISSIFNRDDLIIILSIMGLINLVAK